MLASCAHPAPAPAPAESGAAAVQGAPSPARSESWQLDRSTFDAAAPPCTDFYQYVCGGFAANTAAIPADRAALDAAHDAANASSRAIIAAILTGDDPPRPEDAGDVTRLRTFFASCMAHGDAAERAGRATLGHWLAVVDGIRDRGGVQAALRTLHQAGFPILFQYAGEPDPAARTKYRAEIEVGTLGGRRLLRDPAADPAAYRGHVEAQLAAAGTPAAQARHDAQVVVDLERALVRASPTRDEENDPALAQHVMPPAALARVAPHIAWPAYLAMVGHAAGAPVNVAWPRYLAVVDGVLARRPLADLCFADRWGGPLVAR
ncbi:MAG TPA: M13 family metallopeptidase N-terminal domain-containing protein [Kofleriaceae bacterium]|nr:M13 family metallopeptidase N-terminal domain-containing protein [Kofleriaceae bacterium]